MSVGRLTFAVAGAWVIATLVSTWQCRFGFMFGSTLWVLCHCRLCARVCAASGYRISPDAAIEQHLCRHAGPSFKCTTSLKLACCTIPKRNKERTSSRLAWNTPVSQVLCSSYCPTVVQALRCTMPAAHVARQQYNLSDVYFLIHALE